MIYVAFHYRLPTDHKSNLQGCWRKFSGPRNAELWLVQRVSKADSSPQGEIVYVFKNIAEVPDNVDNWPDFEKQPVSLQKAIRSFIYYCNLDKKKIIDNI